MAVCRLNEIACHHLDHLQEAYPIICAPTEQVICVRLITFEDTDGVSYGPDVLYMHNAQTTRQSNEGKHS